MTQAQQDFQPSQRQSQPARTLQVPEYIQQSQQEPIIAYTLQLPRLEAPNVPFYNPEIISDLRPPSNNYGNAPVVFYEYPAPSRELQVPAEEPWNPSNDPTLYFDNVPSVNNFETPTEVHPKKFNKDVHEKPKQVYTGARKEIPRPVFSSDEFTQQQKNIDKLAKLENQKQIKVPNIVNKEQEPQTQASEPHLTHIDDNIAEDISSSITHSLGVKALPGERFQFHMHGHKGPNSYKWGFDTGKG